MKKSSIIAIGLCLSFFYFQLKASPSDTASVIDNIYNFDFLKARKQLELADRKDCLIKATLNLEINWWIAMESNDEDRFEDFVLKLNQFERNENDDLSKIISLTYRMRYYASINKNYMLPVLYMNILNRIARIDISEFEDSNPEGYELFTLYKSFFNLIQYRYSFDKFFTSSREKQDMIRSIEDIINYGSSSNKTIGRYFLMKYYLDIEKDKTKALNYLGVLHSQYPRNRIFTQLLTN
jgi:hypothetical protein